jgi:cation transport ATPase
MQQSSPFYDRKYDMNYRPRRITVELWMPICCNKCERRVKQHLESIQGAEEVTTDQVSKKVTVTGDMDPNFVLRCAQSHKEGSTFWYMSD